MKYKLKIVFDGGRLGCDVLFGWVGTIVSWSKIGILWWKKWNKRKLLTAGLTDWILCDNHSVASRADIVSYKQGQQVVLGIGSTVEEDILHHDPCIQLLILQRVVT